MKSLRIILVDDHQIMLDGISALLKNDERFSIIGIYTRCAEALAEMQNVDVVITDIQMPEMNGYDATRAIRALPGDKSRVPIIAMSANVMKAEIDRCLEAGMSKFVPKPYKQEQLLSAIESVLNGKDVR